MKDIEGYEERYAVTETGGIWSSRLNGFLKGQPDRKGYLCVSLFTKGNYKEREMAKIHRIVAEAFIPNPKNLPQVNHKNGIKTDNHVKNLEWCTNKQNRLHAIENGMIKSGPNGRWIKTTV